MVDDSATTTSSSSSTISEVTDITTKLENISLKRATPDSEGEEDDDDVAEEEEEEEEEVAEEVGVEGGMEEEKETHVSDATTVPPPPIPSKFKSSRWGAHSRHKPTDQFFTPEVAVDPIFNLIDKTQYPRILEPCCGKKHISNVLEKYGFQVISKDKYTISEESFDYLTSTPVPPESYDAIITNPPFSDKYEIIEKACQDEKPAAFLLPLEILATAKGHAIFERYKVAVGMFYKQIHFIRPDESEQTTAPCAWFFFNFPFCELNYPYIKTFYLKM